MKLLYSGLVVLLLYSVTATAQQAFRVQQHRTIHPAVFHTLPNSFEVDAWQLLKTFSAEIGDTVLIKLNKQYSFKGVVIDKVQQSPTLLTINIKSLQFDGALIHISNNTAEEIDQPLQARILHPRKGDVMLLSKENGKYFLRKEEQQYFLAE